MDEGQETPERENQYRFEVIYYRPGAPMPVLHEGIKMVTFEDPGFVIFDDAEGVFTAYPKQLCEIRRFTIIP